ncbi:unnamed protein product [Blumeria hordei]|uniref:Uncharacterized protein n=1 Tax=Blumeria hordei TaxID=2867405 RepID=A0A383URL5_BLUHO|nr:unnamed protein product [Blumeria hordei]
MIKPIRTPSASQRQCKIVYLQNNAEKRRVFWSMSKCRP